MLPNHYHVVQSVALPIFGPQVPLLSTELLFPFESSFNSSCTPATPSTYLFAYSNDLDPEIVLDSLDTVSSKLDFFQTKYVTFANVRFDKRGGEEISYHSDINNFTDSVKNQLPNSTIGFLNQTTGSDILNVIQKFLENDRCGSTILVLLGRNPDDRNDVSRIIDQLQKQRVFVRTVVFESPLGGQNSSVMYNFSSETNGICVFSYQNEFDDAVDFCTNGIQNEYLLYAYNPFVSGQGSLQLPPLHTPSYFYQKIPVAVEITVQDHGVPYDFRALNLTVTATNGEVLTIIVDRARFVQFNGYFDEILGLGRDQDFELALDYNYSSTNMEALEIRMSVNQPISTWPPYT
ncbi:hypothetical protein L3Y34_003766 [Caenorhabditis briggsae]|uniref:DUF7154 domain-containing protein n=1 Tax=Caenorhabditis briggsae TaxID=6238 RepID=A0AAE9AE16_CAEBR|nr:hypothetical protein L3Y34_003766 [Caenorhabditis briggsae]